MQIVIISDNYPSSNMPNRGAFVYNLAQELSRYHTVTVIAPFKAHSLRRIKNKRGYGEEKCKVYRPRYVSLGNRKLMGVSTASWSQYFKDRAVNFCLNRLSVKPDIIYAHFISNAQTALSFVKKNHLPMVVASGESSYSGVSKNEKVFEDLRACVKHFICVSEANKEGLKSLGFDEHKVTVIPNAVDYALFKPLDKNICRQKLGVPKHKFVVGFVGHFIHRKGPNRVIEAIKSLNNGEVQLICVGGKGNLNPNEFTKIIPPVPNYQLPEIYNAFDIFVLPTLSEGHCNVIEEVKACCVPIISSKGTTVERQVNHQSGILINPMSVGEIADAIELLRVDEGKRRAMTNFLYTERNVYSLSDRAVQICTILENTIKQN